MLGKNGLIGLAMLARFLRKRNGNSGVLVVPTALVGWCTSFPEFDTVLCSKTSASERAMVIGLGGLNLFGVIILGTMLK